MSGSDDSKGPSQYEIDNFESALDRSKSMNPITHTIGVYRTGRGLFHGSRSRSIKTAVANEEKNPTTAPQEVMHQ